MTKPEKKLVREFMELVMIASLRELERERGGWGNTVRD